MSLLALPPEMLLEITAHLSCCDIAHLWLTGSIVLQINLGERGGVRNFTFSSLRHVWPSLVARFVRLIVITYSLNVSLSNNLICPTGVLQSLPTSLRELKLEHPGSVNDFMRFFDSKPAHFANITSLSLSHWISSTYLLDESYCIRSWPEKLTSLEFGQHVPSHFRSNLRVSALPQHLTSLNAS